jgi:tetratricopeptide (TPR) repeat protein
MKKHFFIIFALFFSFNINAFNDSLEKLVDLGAIKHFAKRQFDSSERFYEPSRFKNHMQRDDKDYQNLSHQAFREQKYDEALKFWNLSLKKEEEFQVFTLIKNRYIYFTNKSEFAKAKRSANEILKQAKLINDPSNVATAYYYLANIDLAQKKYKEAEQRYLKFLDYVKKQELNLKSEIFSFKENVFFHRLNLFEGLKDDEMVEKMFDDKIASLAKPYQEKMLLKVLIRRAEFYTKRGNLKKAIEQYDSVLAKLPTDGKYFNKGNKLQFVILALLNKGHLLSELNQHEEALKIYANAKKILFKETKITNIIRGLTYELEGFKEELANIDEKVKLEYQKNEFNSFKYAVKRKKSLVEDIEASEFALEKANELSKSVTQTAKEWSVLEYSNLVSSNLPDTNSGPGAEENKLAKTNALQILLNYAITFFNMDKVSEASDLSKKIRRNFKYKTNFKNIVKTMDALDKEIKDKHTLKTK